MVQPPLDPAGDGKRPCAGAAQGSARVVVCAGEQELADQGARLVCATAAAAARRRGGFSLALAGGNTPRAMHRSLTREPCRSRLPWSRTDFFWADERCVPFSDPASNYGTASEDFLSRVPVVAARVHPMPAETEPEAAAREYEGTLQKVFQVPAGSFPRFDLILLGIGRDGHTASLFPGQASLAEDRRWVLTARGGEPEVQRLTLTLPVINRARQVFVLVSGRSKAEVVREVLEARDCKLPAALVRPAGRLTWLLDREAASLLRGRRGH